MGGPVSKRTAMEDPKSRLTLNSDRDKRKSGWHLGFFSGLAFGISECGLKAVLELTSSGFCLLTYVNPKCGLFECKKQEILVIE